MVAIKASETFSAQETVSGIYGELYAATLGLQKLNDVDEIIEWDGSGNSNGITLDVSNNKMTILTAGDYDISFKGSVTNKRDVDYNFWIRVDGSNDTPIGCARTSDDNDCHGISMGRVLTLAVNNEVQIMGNTNLSGDKDWKQAPGMRFKIIKL